MKYFFAFLGVIFAIVMTLIIVLRFFVNPSPYQDYLTQAVQKLSGEKITYQSARLTGYFRPVFQFSGLTFSGENAPKTTIEKMDVSVGLLSLLNKKMDCSAVRLQDVYMPLPADKKALGDALFAGIYKILTIPDMRSCFGQIDFDDLTFAVGDKNMQMSGIMRLQGKTVVLHLKGLYQDFSGTLDMRVALDINSDMTFDLNLKEDKTQLILKSSGRIHQNQLTGLDGYIKVADTMALLHHLLPQIPPFLTQEVIGNFSWIHMGDEKGFKDFTLNFGQVEPVSITGQYLQGKQNDKLQLFFNTLDTPNITALIALLRDLMTGQENRPIDFDIGVEKMVYNRAKMKNFALKGQGKVGQLTFTSGQVQFDVHDKITFTGQADNIFTPNQTIALSGQVDVPEIGVVFSALLPPSELFQISNFHHFAAMLDYQVGAEGQSIKITEGTLDKTQLSGTVSWDKDDVYTLQLHINQLDANLLLKNASALWDKQTPLSLQSVFQLLAKPFWVQGPKLHFDIMGENIQMGTDNVVSGILKGNLIDGRLKLLGLELNNFYKSTVKLSGIATECGSETPQIQGSVLTLQAPYFTHLQQQMNLTLPPVFQEKQADVMLNVMGQAQQVNVHFKFDATDFILESKGTVLLDLPWHLQDNHVQITYPNFHQFLRKLGYDPTSLAHLDGRLVAQMTLSHSPNQLNVRDLNATIGVQSLSGHFDYTGGDNPQFAGDFQTKFFDIEKIWPFENEKTAPLNWASLYPATGNTQLRADQWRYNGGVMKQGTLTFNKGIHDIMASFQTTNKEAAIAVHVSDLTTGQAHIDFDLQNFPLKTRLFADKLYTLGGGNITAKGQLDCQLQSYNNCFDTMQGNADFSGTHFILGGVNLLRPYTIMRQDVLNQYSEKAFMDNLNIFGQDESDLQTYQGHLLLTPGHLLADKLNFTLTKMTGSGYVEYQMSPPLWTAQLDMSFPDFKTLGKVGLHNKYIDGEHHWYWDAKNFYQNLRQKKTGQEVAERQDNKNALYLWQQQDLADQSLWQDIISWQDMPVNEPFQEEIKALQAQWQEFPKTTIQQLSDSDFQQQKAALQTALEALHQKMQANFEKTDLQGSIFFTEPILTD